MTQLILQALAGWVVCKNFNVLQRTLTDIRDSKTYQVKKLADGNVWMTQNLALVGPFTPDQSDSDVTWNKTDTNAFQLPTQNTGTWCTSTDATCENTANNLSSGNNAYGTYYSWNAATAGTGTYSISTDGDNAPSSICPRGWRLPKDDGSTSTTTNDFQALYSQYNSIALMQNTTTGPGFVLSGRRLGGSTINQSSNGFYWSSTACSAILTYNLNLDLDSSLVFYANYYHKYAGFPVRCLAK